jgi:AraC family transcriptional regulator
MIGVYYDDPGSTAPEALRSHAAFGIADQVAIEPPMERITLPAGRHAVLRFRGPYAGLPAAYDQLFAGWMPENGEEPGQSAAFEIYLNSPMDTAPDDLITEICVPLK